MPMDGVDLPMLPTANRPATSGPITVRHLLSRSRRGCSPLASWLACLDRLEPRADEWSLFHLAGSLTHWLLFFATVSYTSRNYTTLRYATLSFGPALTPSLCAHPLFDPWAHAPAPSTTIREWLAP